MATRRKEMPNERKPRRVYVGDNTINDISTNGFFFLGSYDMIVQRLTSGFGTSTILHIFFIDFISATNEENETNKGNLLDDAKCDVVRQRWTAIECELKWKRASQSEGRRRDVTSVWQAYRTWLR
jgi:hypothetical protein